MPKKKRKKPQERSYARLARHERQTIARMLDRARSYREIAAELGRASSTVTNEVARHRFATAPRSLAGEPAPSDLSRACERLQRWPRCCNGCRAARMRSCTMRPRVRYDARMAQRAAEEELRRAGAA